MRTDPLVTIGIPTYKRASGYFREALQSALSQTSKGKLVDRLLVRRGNAFKTEPLEGEAGAPNACSSVAAGDYDNDMDMDLYLVCTGPVENIANIVYENDGNGNFTVIPNAGGAADSNLGRGGDVVTADFDRDGFLDLFVTNGEGSKPFADEGPHQLFRNLGNDNHWIEIDLEGVVSNRDGIGATVVLKAGDISQIREQRGSIHHRSQNHQRIHFGLGKHEKVDRLCILWPSRILQQIKNIDVDQILRIREPDRPLHGDAVGSHPQLASECRR